MSLDLFAVLLGGATALLPVYARDILGAGPRRARAPALGAGRRAPWLTSIFLARYPLRAADRARPSSARSWSSARPPIVFGLSTSFALSLAALAVLGAADVVSVVIRVSLVQIRTPDAMRGRVSAVHSLFTGTSNQLGRVRVGPGRRARRHGSRRCCSAASALIAVAVLWMLLFPELRRVHQFEE